MPRLIIDTGKIEQNARLVAGMLRGQGMRLVGVTKGCLGDPRVGGAMLRGGAAALADSRPENIARLRRDFSGAELHLIRPVIKDGEQPAADLFFVSSAEQASLLPGGGAAGRAPLRLCLIVETGDGREGVAPERAAAEAKRLRSLAGFELVGLATNAACARPEAPPEAALKTLAGVLGAAGFSGPPAVVSAGGSGLLKLLMPGSGRIAGETRPSDAVAPKAAPPVASPCSGFVADPEIFEFVTDMRCGEAILLGSVPAAAGSGPGLFLEGAHRDAFILEAPVLEVTADDRERGSVRLLLGFGIQDTGSAAVRPLAGAVIPRQATSDYLIASCPEATVRESGLRVGSRLGFVPTYYSLLAAMASPSVEKHFC